jgi:ElaB/YqjD/DUF883 family membrane-anchored ribosome-binding protein
VETYFGEIRETHERIARERVLADLRALTRDSEDLLKATAQDMNEKTRDARHFLASALQRLKASGSEWQKQAFASAKVVAKETDTVIREHPYQSIGIAFGVGVLIGLLAVRPPQPGGE